MATVCNIKQLLGMLNQPDCGSSGNGLTRLESSERLCYAWAYIWHLTLAPHGVNMW